MESRLYRIIRPIVKLFVIVFIRPQYKGLGKIPANGRIILAGTHISNMDALILISATKRNVHFLAKKELWKGPKKILFAHLGLIPVDRKKKNHQALELAENYLNNECLIGIFPEGTTQKKRGLLEFKMGAVKMAKDTDTKIIPFVIIGNYRLFSRNLKVIFGDEFMVSADLKNENNRLRETILKMLEDN